MYKASKRSLISKKVAYILLGVVLLAGLAFGGWYLYQQLELEENTEEMSADESTEEVVDEPEFETFTSDTPSLEFTYPNTWEVSEEDETVLVRSPAVSFQTVEGETVEGYFRIFMRQGAREEDREYIGRGIAARESEALTYDDPGLNQREETRISFFGLDSSDNFAYFFVAGNFDLVPGDSLGSDYGQDEGTYIIGGGYSSEGLTDHLSMHRLPLSGFDDQEVYSQAIDIIKSLKI